MKEETKFMIMNIILFLAVLILIIGVSVVIISSFEGKLIEYNINLSSVTNLTGELK